MAKFTEYRRKVRFNLPSEPIDKLQQQNSILQSPSGPGVKKKIRAHKIILYDNRRSINYNIIQRNQLISSSSTTTILPQYEKNIKQKRPRISFRNVLPAIKFLRPFQLSVNEPKKLIHTNTHFSIPLSMAISKSTISLDNEQRIKHLVIINDYKQNNNTTKLFTIQKNINNNNNNMMLMNNNNNNNKNMENNLKICDIFSRFRIIEDILQQKRKSLKLSEKADRKIFYLKPLRTSVPQANEMNGIKNFLYNTENHSCTLANLIQRLKRMRLRENDIKIENNIMVTIKKDPLESAVLYRSFKTSDVVKRFGSFKMNLEREPSIPTLLRAARDADSYLLKIILKRIINDGIIPEVLNKTDRSGRTAISYICSTDLVQFLDVLLQLKGIDVNIGDNEGNTPLHYAAQSGQSEIVNMLLTRCRSIQVDAKNCWGFTPMMKAALQGKTRCAKLLLFAGASPTETDNSRCLNAIEWAKFTGRESCAEMIEKCSIARNIKENTTTKNLNNNIKRSNSLLSKINKMIPFKSSIKDKQTCHNNNNSSNLKNNSPVVNNIKLYGSEFDKYTETFKSNHDLGKNVSSVPKLIITQQNERKFEKKQQIIYQKCVVTPKRRVRNEYASF